MRWPRLQLTIHDALQSLVLAIAVIVAFLDREATALFAADASEKPYGIQVVDELTQRGVPLIELTTVNQLKFFTDSNGYVALQDPDLTGQDVFFHVRGHGYEHAADGFGYRGKRLRVTPGERGKIVVKRINIAERMYRVTGGGIYRDSVILGEPAPIEKPLINGLVWGQDSVLTAKYRNRVYWFWGDTNRPQYPLGNFHVPGATSPLPGEGGLSVAKGVDLNYFVGEDGFVSATAKLPGDGPTWIDGLTVVTSATGEERMFAGAMKIKGMLDVYRRELVEWNDEQRQWKSVAEIPLTTPAYPAGHPVDFSSSTGAHIYYARPVPLTRVQRDAAAIQDLASYENYTCLKEGTKLEDAQIVRNKQGRAVYAWKKNTPVVSPIDQAKLITQKQLKASEGLVALRDVATGTPIQAHAGSTYWNRFREKWVMIFVQFGGSSFLGEVWYAEADSLLGPWAYCTKVVTHDQYSFYNPKHHPLFDEDGGQRIYFEGTYASTFSGNPVPTPRYDYNQVMYRLDLNDARLNLPLPVVMKGAEHQLRPAMHTSIAENITVEYHNIPFFAAHRPGPGLVELVQDDEKTGVYILAEHPEQSQKNGEGKSSDKLTQESLRSVVIPLFRFHDSATHVFYSISPEHKDVNGKVLPRDQDPVGYVWPNPWSE